MKRLSTCSALSAAAAFGAGSMAAQTLLLRRFLWSAGAVVETGVSLYLACWLLWGGLGAAAAASRVGRRLTARLARAVWAPVLACAALYFVQYELVAHLRDGLGAAGYERLALPQLVLGCLLASAPLCFAAGFVVPAVCARLSALGEPASRAFAWEALGAAAGGLGLALLLARGVSPDPRDEAEWRRYFPAPGAPPGRFETGGGTTFCGVRGGSFYALSSGGVGELLPEEGRAAEAAALALSQRPDARSALLLGRAPLAAGVALARLRPGLPVTWCPCDARYGLRVAEAARAAGLVPHSVRAAGLTPQALLAAFPGGAFDLVLVVPPPATSLEGAAWRRAAFAGAVRRVTARAGAALFGLGCEAAALTPEAAALAGATVGGVREAWPEAGLFAAGAGGWWIAAQAPGLVCGAQEAASRFASLGAAGFSPESVRLLYDEPRAARLAQACPALGAPAGGPPPPPPARDEEVLAAGLCDALRQAWPTATPGAWLERLREAGGVRLAGLLLVALWLAPAALGATAGARRRLLAAWLAACGALGLAASLGVLYRIQAAFGSLYTLAGAGSCLYLAGLFCGNRLAAAVAERLAGRSGALWAAVLAATAIQAGLALGVTAAAEGLRAATGLAALCFAAGAASGAALPLALGLCGAEDGAAPAELACADALGAALGGAAFAVLVPLAGLPEAVAGFAALACGAALCAAGGSGHPRLAAGLALAVSLAALGGRVNALRELGGDPVAAEADAADAGAGAPARAPARGARLGAPSTELPGIPRRLDEARVRGLMRGGQLATNAAAYWE